MRAIKSTVILVFLIYAAFIACVAFAATPDYKTMPLHQAIAELKNTSDNGKVNSILDGIVSRKPETQQDKDALNDAIDSKNTVLQLYAISKVKDTKDSRSIKKLLKNIREIKVHKYRSLALYKSMEDYLLNNDHMAVPMLSARVLGELKNEEALPIIVDKLGEISNRGITIDEHFKNILVLNYGVAALPHIAKKLDALGEKPSHGRAIFLEIIKNTDDKAGADELRKLTGSNALDVRSAAYKALGRMGERFDLTRIFADIDAARAKQLAIAERDRANNKYEGPGSSNPLSEHSLLMDIERDLFDALGQPGNTYALSMLQQRVDKVRKDRYRNYNIGSYAFRELFAIRDIGGPEAFAYLKSVYEEIPVEIYDFGIHKGKKNVRYKVEFLHYFGRKGFVEAIPFLESIMNNKNEETELRSSAALNLYSITDDRRYMQIDRDISGGKR